MNKIPFTYILEEDYIDKIKNGEYLFDYMYLESKYLSNLKNVIKQNNSKFDPKIDIEEDEKPKKINKKSKESKEIKEKDKKEKKKKEVRDKKYI
jgi:hypothetical protein